MAAGDSLAGSAGGGALREFGVKDGEGAALGQVAFDRPQGKRKDGLQQGAGQGQKAGGESLAKRGGRRGGEDNQGDQGDGADIARSGTRRHQHSRGKGTGGFQHDGKRVILSAKAAGEDGEGNEERCGQHAAAAVQVRVRTIREGDVEGARGGHRAARRIAEGDADGERERHAKGIADGHGGLELGAVKTPESGPEAGCQISSRSIRCTAVSGGASKVS